MWDNNAWSYLYGSAPEAEPPFLIQDFIHALQPEARFIAILRDPVERSEVLVDTKHVGNHTHMSHDTAN